MRNIHINLGDLLRDFTALALYTVETFLGLRFILKLFGANAGNGFVDWVYDNTQPLLDPFETMFNPLAREGVVLEFSTLFAMLVYALAAYLIYALVSSVADAVTKS